MKARVKATGEIVDIEDMSIVTYKSDDGTYVKTLIKNFTFIDAEKDYYTKLEHQYAGMAMQGLLANPAFWKMDWCNKDTSYVDLITMRAHSHAHALVEKLKEKEK